MPILVENYMHELLDQIASIVNNCFDVVVALTFPVLAAVAADHLQSVATAPVSFYGVSPIMGWTPSLRQTSSHILRSKSGFSGSLHDAGLKFLRSTGAQAIQDWATAYKTWPNVSPWRTDN
jgi:hypothetical protein